MKPIQRMLLDMARFYSHALDEREAEIMQRVLAQFPEQLVLECGKKYVHNVKNSEFPKPIHKIMKDYLPKEPDPIDYAREASARVIQAVSKFGWPNGPEAKEFIGDLGWRAVERFGGWPYICENLGVTLSPDTFYAQVRDLCKSSIELGSSGQGDSPIGLNPASDKGIGLVSNLVNIKTLSGNTPEIT